jgi:DNA-binding MarR family transcriptional regulator
VSQTTQSLKRPRRVAVAAEKSRASNAKAFADSVLLYDEQMRGLFSVPAISPASRLLLFMIAQESISIKEAMLAVPLSYRAFYTMLDTLKSKALVNVEPDAEDGRVRRLVLGDAFRRIERQLTLPNQPC